MGNMDHSQWHSLASLLWLQNTVILPYIHTGIKMFCMKHEDFPMNIHPEFREEYCCLSDLRVNHLGSIYGDS